MALLRSAARALRLLQPLEKQDFLLARRPAVGGPSPRLLSSSVPTETRKCIPSSDYRSSGTTELKRHANEKNEDILRRLSMKADKLSDGLDRQSRLLEELEVQIKNNNRSREIDLTPAVVLISASLLSFGLYKYVQG